MREKFGVFPEPKEEAFRCWPSKFPLTPLPPTTFNVGFSWGGERLRCAYGGLSTRLVIMSPRLTREVLTGGGVPPFPTAQQHFRHREVSGLFQ